MKNEQKKKITLEDVAEMTERGFESASKELGEVKKELKSDFGLLKDDMKDVKGRLMTIETLLASNIIEKLEDRMRVVLTHLKLDSKF